MTTSLTERYIAATIKDLPDDLHTEVRLELEASIADAVEARLEQGEERRAAERTVLHDLGDPAILAAGYADRPLYLIGPRYYLTWWRLLKRLVIIIPIIAFSVAAFVQILTAGDFGDVLGAAIPAAITAAVHVFFWVTFIFVVLERTGADAGITWNVDQLPEPREDHPGRPDLIASLVFLGIVLIALVWDQIRGFIRIDDQPVLILNPDLWPWGMLGLLAIIALEIGFAVTLYRQRRWNVTLAITNTALSVLFFTWVITLLTRDMLFSADFVELWSANNVTGDTLYTLAVIFGFGVAIVCIWNIIDGWVKTYRKTQSHTAQQQPAATD